jgi:acetyl-CoA C-acetyltransferase
MKFENAYIPLGHAWSSPFMRWQGDLADVSSLDLACLVTDSALKERKLSASEFSGVVLGMTVPQSGGFYGAPNLAARLGAERITGPMIAQACATSAACVRAAAMAVEQSADPQRMELVVATDRTSNSPLLVFPQPQAQGGAPMAENWVLENFRRDPWTDKAMLVTGETVAAEGGFTREAIDDVTFMRFEQYQAALANDRAFQRRYMVPVELPGTRRAPGRTLDSDAGIHPTTRDGLANLKPASPGGVMTFGAQTHPADGCAGMVVTTRDRARALSQEGVAQILAVGTGRVGPAEMPKAPVPAAQAALKAAGLTIDSIDVVTTHNPFAVNDLWFSQQTGFPLERMNPYGSSLIYGHPQGPTGLRLIAELIETLRLRGGGTGLFTGCAAGDSGMAVIVRVQ